jgi:flavin-binding protein dodecin
MINAYKKIEIVGTSTESVSGAIENAVAKAGETVRNLNWFEVVEQRGKIEAGKVSEFQVTVKLGFKLE